MNYFRSGVFDPLLELAVFPKQRHAKNHSAGHPRLGNGTVTTIVGDLNQLTATGESQDFAGVDDVAGADGAGLEEGAVEAGASAGLAGLADEAASPESEEDEPDSLLAAGLAEP